MGTDNPSPPDVVKIPVTSLIEEQRRNIDYRLNRIESDVTSLHDAIMNRETIEGKFERLHSDISSIRDMIKGIQGEGPTMQTLAVEQMNVKNEHAMTKTQLAWMLTGIAGACGFIWSLVKDHIKFGGN